MFFRLLLLFTLLPLTELYLLLKLSEMTSAATTVVIVILTGVIGAGLARREGLKTWFRIQEQINRGQSPTEELLDGLLILVAGAVLITPGILTDTLGFCLLIPPARRWMKRRLVDHYRKRITFMDPGSINFGGQAEIIDMPEQEGPQ